MPNFANKEDSSEAPSGKPLNEAKRTASASFGAYAVACILCAYLLTWTYPVRALDWHIPLSVTGDGLLVSLITKTLIEHSWYLTNDRMGAPGQLDWYDFPLSDSLHVGMLKFITLWTHSYGLAVNVLFILGFFLITCSALFVLHQMGLSYPSSVAGALLYAFAPYHIFRGEVHFFLSCYYVIPLTVWLILKVLDWTPGSELFLVHRKGKLPRLTRTGIGSVVICVLTGSSGAYYAFFAAILLAVAGLRDIPAARSLARAKVAFAFAFVIGATLILNTAPSVIYNAQHGRNLSIAVRSPLESELYGLKMMQLILPIENHRVPLMNLVRRYHAASESGSEADANCLGAVGSVGLAILLTGSVMGFLRADRRLTDLAFLTLVSLLFGVTGGLGPVFAFFVSAQIRAYNRIAIYLAFFCLAAFFITLEKSVKRLTAAGLNSRARRALLAFGAAGVLIVGFFDQVGPPDVSAFVNGDNYVRELDRFVQKVEATLPPGAMILNFPFMTYPEAGPIHSMNAYDPIAAYLASSNLRWSYGASRGRYTGAWSHDLAMKPVSQMLQYAVLAGYQGIYIDRAGYADEGVDFEQDLEAHLTGPPLESTGGRFSFYDLRPYAARLKHEYSGGEWLQAARNVTAPIAFELRGCSDEEHDRTGTFQWCGKKIWLIIENPAKSRQVLLLKGRIANGSPEAARIKASSPWFNESHPLSSGASFGLDRRIEAPPGQSVILFESDGVPRRLPRDSRVPFMRLQQFGLSPEGLQIEVEPPQGCYEVQHTAAGEGRWCSAEADVLIDNSSANPLVVTARFQILMGLSAPAVVRIEGPGFSDQVEGSAPGTEYEHTFRLPRGQTRVRISTDAKAIDTPDDPRVKVFQLRNFQVDERVPGPHLIALN